MERSPSLFAWFGTRSEHAWIMVFAARRDVQLNRIINSNTYNFGHIKSQIKYARRMPLHSSYIGWNIGLAPRICASDHVLVASRHRGVTMRIALPYLGIGVCLSVATWLALGLVL